MHAIVVSCDTLELAQRAHDEAPCATSVVGAPGLYSFLVPPTITASEGLAFIRWLNAHDGGGFAWVEIQYDAAAGGRVLRDHTVKRALAAAPAVPAWGGCPEDALPQRVAAALGRS